MEIRFSRRLATENGADAELTAGTKLIFHFHPAEGLAGATVAIISPNGNRLIFFSGNSRDDKVMLWIRPSDRAEDALNEIHQIIELLSALTGFDFIQLQREEDPNQPPWVFQAVEREEK